MTSEEQNIENIRTLITSLGEDPTRDGLKKTPKRFFDSLQFLTGGYDQKPSEIINDALFDAPYSDMVVIRDIGFYSLCEHHMIPFYGKIHVGYIPDGKVIGLSKIPRIVDVFSRRLQVQERLTNDIAVALQETLKPEGVGVVVEAYHLCMMMRGVQKQHSFTITSSMEGSFSNLETRNEFMAHVKRVSP